MALRRWRLSGRDRQALAVARNHDLRRRRRASAAAEGIEESILSQGSMNPMNDVPDHLWFERGVMELTRTVAESEALGRGGVAEARFGVVCDTAEVPQIRVRRSLYCPKLTVPVARAERHRLAPESQMWPSAEKRRTGLEPVTSSLGSSRSTN
jgi:hypothetical protein